jgi:hypothetical protein
VEEVPFVRLDKLEVTSLAYSELRSVSNFGRWKEGGRERYGSYVEVQGKEVWSRANSTVGASEIDTSRIRCASGKETMMWSMADHESVSPDVVERLYVE